MRPRPLVDLDVPLPPDALLGRFRGALVGDGPCRGHVGRRELSLEVAAPDRHLWSPRISLEVRETPDGSHLRGRFGPHPNLWTLFVFVYSVLVTVFTAGLVYGYVQVVMGEPPTAFWFATAATVGLGASCSLDLWGRRVGRPQMASVRAFIDDVVPHATDRDAPDPSEP